VLEPVSVALQFGFLAVLYLFLLWVTRSALVDLRRTNREDEFTPVVEEGTSVHTAAGLGLGARGDGTGAPALVVQRGMGLRKGDIYDVGRGIVMGRGDAADRHLEDPFASSRHALVQLQGGVVVIEDLGSTNGTFLNNEQLTGPQPLHAGDRIRIGDTEFAFEVS
jgi:hypothetical protein